MNKQEIIDVIKSQQSVLQSEGVTALYLFGSYARGDADEYSDVDVAIEHTRPFSVLRLIGLRRMLENKLDLPVDVVPREDLAQMNEQPEKSVIQIF